MDDEILLLSWTQLAAVLMLDPENDDYAIAQQEIAYKLEDQFHIEQIQLLSCSFDGYTITYVQDRESKITTFTLDEVEELFS